MLNITGFALLITRVISGSREMERSSPPINFIFFESTVCDQRTGITLDRLQGGFTISDYRTGQPRVARSFFQLSGRADGNRYFSDGVRLFSEALFFFHKPRILDPATGDRLANSSMIFRSLAKNLWLDRKLTNSTPTRS